MTNQSKERKILIIFLFIRIFIFLGIIITFITKNYISTIFCTFSTLLFLTPISKKKKICLEVPSILEIVITLLVFCIIILDVLNKLNTKVHWDTIIHTIIGFLYALICFYYITRLIKKRIDIKLPLPFICIISILFSMTAGVCWEMYEYSADKVFERDMQKDVLVTTFSSVNLNKDNKLEPVTINKIKSSIINTDKGPIIVKGGYIDIGLNDTMKDLIVTLIGSLTFCILNLLFILNKEKYHYIKKIIPHKMSYL